MKTVATGRPPSGYIPHHAFRGEGSDRLQGDMTHKHWTSAVEPGEMALVTTPAEGLWAESRGLGLETASSIHPAPPNCFACIVHFISEWL